MKLCRRCNQGDQRIPGLSEAMAGQPLPVLTMPTIGDFVGQSISCSLATTKCSRCICAVYN